MITYELGLIDSQIMDFSQMIQNYFAKISFRSNIFRKILSVKRKLHTKINLFCFPLKEIEQEEWCF